MKIKEGYIVRKVADNGVVVSLKEMDCNHLMTMNQSGIDIWNIMQQDVSVNEIVTQMQKIYDADSTVIRADVERFIVKLREAGLIEE